MGVHSTAPPKQELLAKIAELPTRQAVADYYGVDYSTFWRWGKKYRIPITDASVMHYKAKLTEEDVRLARLLLDEDMRHCDIAKKLDTTPGIISALSRYETYITVEHNA